MFPETPADRSLRSPPKGAASLRDDYARYAEQCQRMASSCKSDGEKNAWLRVAAAWLRLANDMGAREVEHCTPRDTDVAED